MSNPALKTALDALYNAYDYENELQNDPLVCVHRFHDAKDIEIAGLLCSALAYGRVSLFLPKLNALLAHMCEGDGTLRGYIDRYKRDQIPPFLTTFKYRMSTGYHLHRLFGRLHTLLQEYGTIEGIFQAGFDLAHDDIGPALHAFIQKLYAGSTPPDRGFCHLLPDPKKGSACKRLNLYLRWMIRSQKGLDLGIWCKIPPTHLVMPLDVHSMRMAYNLGLTQRKSANWKTALEVTQNLKAFDAQDPVKYDFALCHMAMAGDCHSKRDMQICPPCGLKAYCRWW